MIGGFNSYMGGMKKPKGKARPASRNIGRAAIPRPVMSRPSAVRNPTAARAAAARNVNQGRVVSAQRKAAQRGRGR